MCVFIAMYKVYTLRDGVPIAVNANTGTQPQKVYNYLYIYYITYHCTFNYLYICVLLYIGYIAAHNVLLAHASVVELYRGNYQAHQQGGISIVLNHDWNEPLTADPLDIAAAERKNIFAMAWFADPIVYGDYPQVMKDFVGSRLPVFTGIV